MTKLHAKTILNVLAVISFLGLMTYLLTADQQKVTTSVPLVLGTKTIINQDSHGNYVTEGTIEGFDCSMLIDTGASTLVVAESFALEIGLPKLRRVMVNTANGASEGYLTIVRRIQIGSLLGKNIDAVIVPNIEIPHVLVGMNFLKNINFEKSGRQLILQPGS